MIRALVFIIRRLDERRRIKHVIRLLDLEESRVRLDPNGKAMGNYLRSLRRYLEEA